MTNSVVISLREGLVWRLIALAVVPGVIFLTTAYRYEFRAERAGGIHYQVRIDQRNDKACLIMRDGNVTAGLQGYLCSSTKPD
jgi:hypothetical protein